MLVQAEQRLLGQIEMGAAPRADPRLTWQMLLNILSNSPVVLPLEAQHARRLENPQYRSKPVEITPGIPR